jgi:hypothetical protein
MENLRLYVNTVDGGYLPLDFDSGRELIGSLITDDWGAPLTVFGIEAIAEDGTRVEIRIPYDDRATVYVDIVGPKGPGS